MPATDPTNHEEADTSILSQKPPPLTHSQSRKVRDSIYKSISQDNQTSLLQEAMQAQKEEMKVQREETVAQISQLFQGTALQLRDEVVRRDQEKDAKIQEILEKSEREKVALQNEMTKRLTEAKEEIQAQLRFEQESKRAIQAEMSKKLEEAKRELEAQLRSERESKNTIQSELSSRIEEVKEELKSQFQAALKEIIPRPTSAETNAPFKTSVTPMAMASSDPQGPSRPSKAAKPSDKAPGKEDAPSKQALFIPDQAESSRPEFFEIDQEVLIHFEDGPSERGTIRKINHKLKNPYIIQLQGSRVLRYCSAGQLTVLTPDGSEVEEEMETDSATLPARGALRIADKAPAKQASHSPVSSPRYKLNDPVWYHFSGWGGSIAATITEYCPKRAKPYTVLTDKENFFKASDSDLEVRIPNQPCQPVSGPTFSVDERVLYCCPEKKQEFLGIVLEANFAKTPPYTLLLEGEEQISAFPDELKKGT